MLEEFNDLLKLLLRLIGARHILERDLHLVARRHARTALAKRHHAASAALRLLHDEEPDADQQKDRQDRREHRRPPRRFRRALRLDLDVLLLQSLEEVRILIRRIGRDRQKLRAISERALDDVVLKRDLRDLAILHLLQKIRIVDLVRHHLTRLKVVNRGDGDQDDQQIKHHTAKKFIQSVILLFQNNALRKSRKLTAFRQNPHIMFQQKATKAPFDSHNKKPLQRFIIALKQVLYKPFRTIFEYFTEGARRLICCRFQASERLGKAGSCTFDRSQAHSQRGRRRVLPHHSNRPSHRPCAETAYSKASRA